jgi:glycogen debranching enzyme
VRVRTPAAFIPLAFGIADAQQAQSLIDQLLDPELFWSKYPVPSVAVSESTFAPNDYWRGPVWFNQNWLILEGLRRYKRDDLAAQLLTRSLDMLTHSGKPSAYEYFNPLTGADLGAVDFGWTGLCNDMIVQYVCGVQRLDEDWQFAPLDIGLDWYELNLPAQEIHVRYDRATGFRVTRRDVALQRLYHLDKQK